MDLGALQNMIGPMLGAMLGGQVASGIAKLSSEVLGAADVGLPLTPTGDTALVPANVKAFAEGLERPIDEVRGDLALRESAHARLFASTPWLTSTIASVLTSAAAGSTPKLGNLTELMGSIDPQNPEEAMQTIAARMEESTDTPEQHARESQLETVSPWSSAGWTTSSPAQRRSATRRARPAGSAASPACERWSRRAGVRRDRRARTPAPPRPRRRGALGEAAGSRRRGSARSGRSHPDFMPSSADLDDPDAFVASFTGPQLDFSALDELTGPDGDPGARASDDAGENDAGKNAVATTPLDRPTLSRRE